MRSLFAIRSLRHLALLVPVALVALATGCSGGSSSSGAATPDITGAYINKSAEPGYAWMSFFDGDQYIAFYNQPGCDTAQAPPSCGSYGTYSVDGDTLTLDDTSTGTTKSMPLSVQMRAQTSAAEGTTVVKDLTTGGSGSGSLVTGSGSSLVQSQPQSLTVGGQQLVPSAGTQTALLTGCNAVVAMMVACSLVCTGVTEAATGDMTPHIEMMEPEKIPIEQPVAACGPKP